MLHDLERVTIQSMVSGSIRWVLRFVLLTGGAALWSGRKPSLLSKLMSGLYQCCTVVQPSFRIPGGSISSVAWAAHDSGCSTKSFPACWLLAVMECVQGELVKTAAESLHSEQSSTAQWQPRHRQRQMCLSQCCPSSYAAFPRQLSLQAISQRHSVLLPQPPASRLRPLWFSLALPLFHPFILSWCLLHRGLLFPT